MTMGQVALATLLNEKYNGVIDDVQPVTRNIAKSDKGLIWSVFYPFSDSSQFEKKSPSIRFMPYCKTLNN